MTSETMTVAWAAPPPDLREHVHYYNIIATSHNSEKRETHIPIQQNYLYVFQYLEPATNYTFKIAACNEYTKLCGNWSKEVTAGTLDGGI